MHQHEDASLKRLRWSQSGDEISWRKSYSQDLSGLRHVSQRLTDCVDVLKGPFVGKTGKKDEKELQDPCNLHILQRCKFDSEPRSVLRFIGKTGKSFKKRFWYSKCRWPNEEIDPPECLSVRVPTRCGTGMETCKDWSKTLEIKSCT